MKKIFSCEKAYVDTVEEYDIKFEDFEYNFRKESTFAREEDCTSV